MYLVPQKRWDDEENWREWLCPCVMHAVFPELPSVFLLDFAVSGDCRQVEETSSFEIEKMPGL